MPFSRSFRRVCLMCDLRAAAMRRCQCWILFAASSISAVRKTPLSHQLRTRAATVDTHLAHRQAPDFSPLSLLRTRARNR